VTDEAARALEARRSLIDHVGRQRKRDRWGIARTWREWYCVNWPSTWTDGLAQRDLPGTRQLSSIVAADTKEHAPDRRRLRARAPEVTCLAEAEPGDVVAVCYRGEELECELGGFIWARTAALLRRINQGRIDYHGPLIVIDSRTGARLVRPAPWSF
jgi:hypothetical protein